MPFEEPYAQCYNIGDLIYGLHETKKKYDECYTALYNRNKFPSDIGNYAFTPKEISSHSFVNNEDYKKIIATHPKYKSILEDKNYYVLLKQHPHKTYMIKNPLNKTRKHKAGFYIGKETHKAGFRFQIHFLLDGLNVRQIREKSHPYDKIYDNPADYFCKGLDRVKKYVKPEDIIFDPEYCINPLRSKFLMGSCLRWLYRNRKDPHLKAVVQFWYHGKPCCPPWDQNFDKICKKNLSWVLLDSYYDNQGFEAD